MTIENLYHQKTRLTNRITFNYILNQTEHHRKVTFTEEYETYIKFYQKTLYPAGKYFSK